MEQTVKKEKVLPGPVSERQHMYVVADVDVVLYGGEPRASI